MGFSDVPSVLLMGTAVEMGIPWKNAIMEEEATDSCSERSKEESVNACACIPDIFQKIFKVLIETGKAMMMMPYMLGRE